MCFSFPGMINPFTGSAEFVDRYNLYTNVGNREGMKDLGQKRKEAELAVYSAIISSVFLCLLCPWFPLFVMILFVADDGTGTVELFGEKEADKLVRKGEAGQGPGEASAFENTFVEAKGAADKEDEVAGAFRSALLQECGEGDGRQVPAVLI